MNGSNSTATPAGTLAVFEVVVGGLAVSQTRRLESGPQPFQYVS